ncbi:hypothetical protein ABZ896_37740 [Streptomyces sp. NPDC047072]|uniref:hypothetical protein n=1 Tax=Streptomyces sp. NPDC047072 TaxID=3154809 RepID=UPI0033C8B0FC
MSRGEETDEPVGEDDYYAVVIHGDGSATIDDEPVTVAEGSTADAAVLDRLHSYARVRNVTVTAAISDASAGYVAYVEVAPDGSSRLLEQREPDGVETDEAEALGVGVVTVDFEDDEDDDDEDDLDDDYDDETDDEFDEASYALPEPPPPPSLHKADAHDQDDEDDDSDVFEGFDDEPRPLYAASPSPGLNRTPPTPLVRTLDRGNDSRQSDDEYRPSGLLHRPVVIAPAALAVAGLVIVSLVYLGSNGSSGDDQKKETLSSSDLSASPSLSSEPPLPTFSVDITPPPAPTVTLSPSMSPKPSNSASASGSSQNGPGGGTVTVTATPPKKTVTAKPAVETAATAVQRLAQRDPGGRHICYRAFVAKLGWQKPVCDGTLAGTTGQGLAIKALNIAVSGVDGSAANAMAYNSSSSDGNSKWAPSWTAITGNGKNIYIGKTSAKYITGFAINVGSGSICEQTKVSGFAWGSKECADKRPDYEFGGTVENGRYMEAVKLTV